MSTVTVSKLNHAGEVQWQYQGELLALEPDRIVLQAIFDREAVPVHDLILRRGDRFIEIYYTDRWYNIYEIYDGEDKQLKALYCNIGLPAEIQDLTVSYRDLALDLLIYPDGRQVILDEDEFQALPLSPQVRSRARSALEELQEKFRGKNEMNLEWDG